MKVLVVGAGTMGRWFGELVLDAFEDVDLALTDRDPDVAERAAADLDANSVEAESIEAVSPEAAEAADLVCIAVPMSAATEAIRIHGSLARRALVDVTGTMAEPIAAMRSAATDVERASLHPLFAPDNEPGNVAIVLDEPGPIVETIESALSGRGNTVVRTDPETHDEAMETVQAKAHTAILAFACAAEEVSPAFHTPISEGLEALVDQVTGGEATVYAEIQDAFDGAEDVAGAARSIADADAEAFVDIYEEAGE